LKAEIAKLQAANVPVNPDYTDSEFVGKEDLMYSDEYVAAAYNAVPESGGVGMLKILIVLFFIILIPLIVWLIFVKQFK